MSPTFSTPTIIVRKFLTPYEILKNEAIEESAKYIKFFFK
jgi:hypothetical protein